MATLRYGAQAWRLETRRRRVLPTPGILRRLWPPAGNGRHHAGGTASLPDLLLRQYLDAAISPSRSRFSTFCRKADGPRRKGRLLYHQAHVKFSRRSSTEKADVRDVKTNIRCAAVFERDGRGLLSGRTGKPIHGYRDKLLLRGSKMACAPAYGRRAGYCAVINHQLNWSSGRLYKAYYRQASLLKFISACMAWP